MPLQRIELQYQSHRGTTLDLSPGVNAIVGSSDSGKSAILRAVFWAIYNRPKGAAFIPHGLDCAYAKIKTDAGTVVRYKGSKQDYYQVNGGEQLTALRGDVPQAVQDVIGLDDVCVQRQFDPHYLIFDSPGKIAQALNAVTRLEDADGAAYRLRRQAADLSANVAALGLRQDALTQEAKQLAWVDAATGQMQRIDALALAVDAIGKQRTRLTNAASQIIDTDKLLAALPMIPDVADKILAIEQGAAASAVMTTRRKRLAGLYSELSVLPRYTTALPDITAMAAAIEMIATAKQSLEQQMTRLMDLTDALTGLKNIPEIADASHLEGKAGVLLGVGQGVFLLTNRLRRLTELEQSLGQLDMDIAGAIAAYTSEKATVTICPSCRQPLATHEARQCVLESD